MSAPAIQQAPDSAPNSGELRTIQLQQMLPSPHNPRKYFDEEALAELAASIREVGLLEPIIVRQVRTGHEIHGAEYGPDDRTYEILAGERRWRAAYLAGLETIPALVRDVDEQQGALLRIVENLQRVDISPMELARGFEALHSEFGLSEPAIAQRTGRSQPAINKARSLLKLPADVQDRLERGDLSAAHGAALLKYKKFPALASRLAAVAVERHWTSKFLEDAPYTEWDIARAGVVKTIDFNTRFDKAICDRCPFGAMRHPREDYHRYCLKPEHFEELQAAAKAEAEEQAAETAAKLAAPDAGNASVRIADLGYSSYTDLSYRQRPAGCSADCPCARTAVGRDGQPAPICIDPKRFDKLKEQQDRADKKATRTLIKEQHAEFLRRLDALEELGPREMALLVAAAQPNGQYKAVEAAIARHPAADDFKDPYGMWRLDYQRLMKRTVLEQLKLALDVLLSHEMAEAYEAGTRLAGRLSWYLNGWKPGDAYMSCACCGTKAPLEQLIARQDGRYMCQECDGEPSGDGDDDGD